MSLPLREKLKSKKAPEAAKIMNEEMSKQKGVTKAMLAAFIGTARDYCTEMMNNYKQFGEDFTEKLKTYDLENLDTLTEANVQEAFDRYLKEKNFNRPALSCAPIEADRQFILYYVKNIGYLTQQFNIPKWIFFYRQVLLVSEVDPLIKKLEKVKRDQAIMSAQLEELKEYNTNLEKYRDGSGGEFKVSTKDIDAFLLIGETKAKLQAIVDKNPELKVILESETSVTNEMIKKLRDANTLLQGKKKELAKEKHKVDKEAFYKFVENIFETNETENTPGYLANNRSGLFKTLLQLTAKQEVSKWLLEYEKTVANNTDGTPMVVDGGEDAHGQ